MARILVTGGAGYIGSHTAKALAAAGHEPVLYDSLINGHAWAALDAPLIEADIRDEAALNQAMADHQIEAVMHFAALIEVGHSVRQPALFHEVNFGGSATLLKAMQAAGVKHIVFSSSCAVYGEPMVERLDEHHVKQPINPYGASKLAVEEQLEAADKAGALSYMALRYFNAAGADADGQLGEAHDPETHVIPRAILAALGAAPMFQINGTDYATPDGTAVRDYVHVSDLATAHLAAIEHLLSGGQSAALNLGSGQGYSVKQVVDAVAEALGRPVPHQIGPRREGDSPALVADPSAAKSLLKWAPTQSDLTTIVQSAASWHQKQLAAAD
ncbi:MAG: UDP-glucose 4-epimerase GalE [Alphaproteobacteria bacterium]|nr:UDP-glucose 4-epimerase GalE [Alphaproteobacteria bacterium SS10]